MSSLNTVSLDTICAALAETLGIDPPKHAAQANRMLTDYVNKAFGGKKADRIVMYNPDAVGQWLYEKYPYLLEEVENRAGVKVPLCTVMPSVTPVCFGTMYTGAQPAVHGIQKYEKPVIRLDTLFDALIRAGKKPAIVAYAACSMRHIFLEREMDYFFFDTVEQVNAKAAELIMRDEHDFIAVYNGNYDYHMHRSGPESIRALSEMRVNAHVYAVMEEMIRTHWKKHRTLLGFAMDHGAHEIDGQLGSHGLDMPEDLNIMHFYEAIEGTECQ